MMRLAGLDLTGDCVLELVTRLRRADLGNQADRIADLVKKWECFRATAPRHGRRGFSS